MKKIIHVDADCFFASVELKKRPDLKSWPVAVGGSPYSRGVVTTCNYVARAYGVRSAMSSKHALTICPDLQFFSPDMALYKDFSNQIFEILKQYSEQIQIVSIDEAYLDVTNSELFSGSATLIARDIQTRVKRELGLDISAGVAPLKYLAKIASDWNKPAGIYTISPVQVSPFLKQLELKYLPGVGPFTMRKLNQLGLRTCGDVLNCDQAKLFAQLGSFSASLWNMCLGKDSRGVESNRSVKSVSVEETFSTDVGSFALLRDRMPELLSRLDRRFQKLSNDMSQMKASKRYLKLKFSDFSQTSVEACLSSFGEIIDSSEFQKLSAIAWNRRNQPVRLMGLGLRFSDSNDAKQLELPFLADY